MKIKTSLRLEHKNIDLSELRKYRWHRSYALFKRRRRWWFCMCVKMVTMMRKGCLISVQPLKLLTKTGHCWIRQQNSNKRWRGDLHAGYLYTHTHTHSTTHAQSHIVQHPNTHTLHSSQYISSINTHWCRLEHARAHTQNVSNLQMFTFALTYTCIYACLYTHADADYTIHTRRCASYARIHTHTRTQTNKHAHACTHFVTQKIILTTYDVNNA